MDRDFQNKHDLSMAHLRLLLLVVLALVFAPLVEQLAVVRDKVPLRALVPSTNEACLIWEEGAM